MVFNNIIKERMGPLLETYGFKLTKETSSSRGSLVTYSSEKIILSFSNDRYEYSYSFFLQSLFLKFLTENFILEGFLSIERERSPRLRTEDEKAAQWIDETLKYFLSYKETLLTGDLNFYQGLNEYVINTRIESNKRNAPPTF